MLADELRSLINTLMSTQPSKEQQADLATQVRAMHTSLDSEPRSRYWERGESGTSYRAYSPFRGTLNPVAPPLIMEPFEPAARRVEATAIVPAVYEGPPLTVHGGMVAALFDEIMGAAQAQLLTRSAGVTGRLQVRYRKPTPTNKTLRFSAWIETDTPRACTVQAECRHDDVRTAQASALFVRTIVRTTGASE